MLTTQYLRNGIRGWSGHLLEVNLAWTGSMPSLVVAAGRAKTMPPHGYLCTEVDPRRSGGNPARRQFDGALRHDPVTEHVFRQRRPTSVAFPSLAAVRPGLRRR